MANEKPCEICFDRCLNLSGNDFKYFPDCPAVYVVYSGSVVLYIGSTESLQRRWANGHHRRTFKRLPVRVAWFPLPKHLLRKTEKALITAYCPVINCNWVPKGSLHIYAGNTRELKKLIKANSA